MIYENLLDKNSDTADSLQENNWGFFKRLLYSLHDFEITEFNLVLSFAGVILSIFIL